MEEYLGNVIKLMQNSSTHRNRSPSHTVPVAYTSNKKNKTEHSSVRTCDMYIAMRVLPISKLRSCRTHSNTARSDMSSPPPTARAVRSLQPSCGRCCNRHLLIVSPITTFPPLKPQRGQRFRTAVPLWSQNTWFLYTALLQ